jgi:hypothetical protein
MVHTVLAVVTMVLLWWTAGVAAAHVPIYEQLEMKSLPFMTDLMLKMSPVVLHPGFLIAGGVVGLALIVLGHFGFMDRALLPLILAEALVVAILVFGWLVAIPAPLRQIQEKLAS